MASLTLDSSNVNHEQPMPGFFAIRITNCGNGDTLALPVSNIISAVGVDETNAGVIKVARTNATTLTITCTANDEIMIHAFAIL